EAGAAVRIVGGSVHEHADESHPLPLLRARREGPRGRAANKRDELAPPHCSMHPVLPTERIAHLGRAGDCRRAGLQSRLCRLRAILDRGGTARMGVREIAERFQVRHTKSVKQGTQLIAWITEYGEACPVHHFRESSREVLLELS